MDTVYGTKKYFHNVLDNECSRSLSNRVTANYSSYQNTLGRASNPYTHMNKFVCPTDMSVTSQYGYYNNPRNMWKDTRNLTHSSFSSSRKNKNMKSFTVLLMTAAFIVMLAVISIAALAFYFSTYKSSTNDSIMVFNGKMQISRGDVFTSSLKYNHTSAFQQKAELYGNLIEKALKSNGLEVSKCEVTGFGSGPPLNVFFRIFLDTRTVPMNIKNIEEYIKNSLLNEMAGSSATSTLNNFKIDANSIVVKRLLDNELIQSASFIIEQTTLPSILFEELPNTKSTSTKQILSTRPSYRVLPEKKPDVIKGSFQVTKTDADITEKRTFFGGTSTLRPFTVTNGNIKVKTKKITIEKVKPLPKNSESLKEQYESTTTDVPITTTKKIPSNSRLPSSSITTLPTTVAKLKSSTAQRTTTERLTTVLVTSTTQRSTTITIPILDHVEDLGQWKPISPVIKTNIPELNSTKTKSVTQNTPSPNISVPNHSNYFDKNASAFIENTEFRPMFYHSYANPAFASNLDRFEQLGKMRVKPYPLPVNKITDDVDDPLNINNYSEVSFSEPEISDEVIVDIQSTNSTNNKTGEILLEILQNPEVIDVKTSIPIMASNFSIELSEKSNININDPILADEDTEEITEIIHNPESNESNDTDESVKTEKPQNIWTQPSLFPVNSKFDNENRTFHQFSPVRKIFNETLHAWIIESAPKMNGLRPMSDFISQRNAVNQIKNISSIFDTLSSKLGVSPNISTKLPPFINFPSSKTKNSSNNFGIEQLNKRINDHIALSRLPSTSTPSLGSIEDIPTEKEIIPMVYPSKPSVSLVGEAEIEEVDPTQYEDMLLSEQLMSSSSTVPTLITLLPVKSNSGIRKIPNKGTGWDSQKSI